MNPTLLDRIEEIRLRWELATPGHYRMRQTYIGHRLTYLVEGNRQCPAGQVEWDTVATNLSREDAEFFVHARQDIADLLAMIAELESQVAI